MIVTLIMSALLIDFISYIINSRIFFHITYFLTFGAIFIFVNYYFVHFSYKNKFLYNIVVTLGVIVLSYILMNVY